MKWGTYKMSTEISGVATYMLWLNLFRYIIRIFGALVIVIVRSTVTLFLHLGHGLGQMISSNPIYFILQLTNHLWCLLIQYSYTAKPISVRNVCTTSTSIGIHGKVFGAKIVSRADFSD